MKAIGTLGPMSSGDAKPEQAKNAIEKKLAGKKEHTGKRNELITANIKEISVYRTIS